MRSLCPHAEHTDRLCDQCVTVIAMALGVLDRATIDEVTALADDYAGKIVDDLPSVESDEHLRNGLSGALLSFLADAILLAHSLRA